MKLRRFRTAAPFLEHAEGWLMKREAEHNLILGVAHDLARGARAFEEPVYLASVEDASGVVGCAFRSPPFKLGLTRIPEEALPLVVADVARVYESLPALLGPEPTAHAFAELWKQQTGCDWRPGMRQCIYALEKKTDPASPAPGAMRPATAADVPVVSDWATKFKSDVGMPDLDSEKLTEQLIATRSLFLWEDGVPCCMAAAIGETPNGVRVGFVYTPPERRRRGYASSCVAELTGLLLRRGRRFCFLYADLANPTSNAIYERIGYRPVCEVVDVNFVSSG